MALVRCEDCKKPVSEDAEACPRCGRPPGDKEHWNKNIPIVSPWTVYVCGGLGKFRMLFLSTALLMVLGYLYSLKVDSWVLTYLTLAVFAASFFLTFALPSVKTAIAMVIANKFTRSSPRKIREVVDVLIGSKDSSEEEKT